MKELSESDDIWATIAPGSAARAQKFLTRQADDSVTASIITCREAYTALSGQWASLIDEMTLVAGRQLYPRQTEALAKAQLMADLQIASQYLYRKTVASGKSVSVRVDTGGSRYLYKKQNKNIRGD